MLDGILRSNSAVLLTAAILSVQSMSAEAAHDHPGQAYSPDQPAWRYIADPPQSFFSGFISGAQRLPNGNTLITHGPQGLLFEVDRDGAGRSLASGIYHYELEAAGQVLSRSMLLLR